MPQTIVDIKNITLPKGVTYTENNLKISKNMKIEDPLIFSLNANEKLVIEAMESSEAKIIIEINNSLKEDLEYNLDLVLKPNSNVTFLLVSELASENAVINQNFIVEKDANLKLMAGFLNNKLAAKLNS